EISASTFTYIAKNIVNGYLPAIGNAEVFSGKQLFERPPQREMNNVEDRNLREVGNYVYRPPCGESLRCDLRITARLLASHLQQEWLVPGCCVDLRQYVKTG